MSYCFDRPGISSTALRKWFWKKQQTNKEKIRFFFILTIVKNYLSSGLFKFFQFAVIAIDIWADDENEDDEDEDNEDEDNGDDGDDGDDDGDDDDDDDDGNNHPSISMHPSSNQKKSKT